MKSFFWRFFICVAPVLLALWLIVLATVGYMNGEPPRRSRSFKLGVDLVGGTILVYEIDTRKSEENKGKGDSGMSDRQKITLLAESLKRRIDPNDLYNIVIRPAPSEGRVEIIIPTGGAHQTQVAEQKWRDILDEIEAEYKLGGKYHQRELTI